MLYTTTNPYTGEVVKTFPNVTDADVKLAIERAHVTFPFWKETAFAGRAKVMQSAAHILRKDLEAHPKLLTVENCWIWASRSSSITS